MSKKRKYNKETFTLEDMRRAFLAGRRSVEPHMEYFFSGESYPSNHVVKSFKQWMSENFM